MGKIRHCNRGCWQVRYALNQAKPCYWGDNARGCRLNHHDIDITYGGWSKDPCKELWLRRLFVFYLNPRESYLSSSWKWTFIVNYHLKVIGMFSRNFRKFREGAGKVKVHFEGGCPLSLTNGLSYIFHQATICPEKGFCDASWMLTRLPWNTLR
jgi:hypothetical protein